MQIAVINASLSQSSTAASLGRRILESLTVVAQQENSPEITSQWFDLRPHSHALVDTLLSGFPSPEIDSFFDKLANSDAVLALTPIYQGSYSGLFKLFCDVLPDDLLRGKPVLLGATGGTARHGLVIDRALRPLFAYLGAMSIPTGIYAATQDWGDPGLEKGIAEDEPLQYRIDRASRELWQMASGNTLTPEPLRLRSSTDGDTSATTYPGFVDFETLLGRR